MIRRFEKWSSLNAEQSITALIPLYNSLSVWWLSALKNSWKTMLNANAKNTIFTRISRRILSKPFLEILAPWTLCSFLLRFPNAGCWSLTFIRLHLAHKENIVRETHSLGRRLIWAVHTEGQGRWTTFFTWNLFYVKTLVYKGVYVKRRSGKTKT